MTNDHKKPVWRTGGSAMKLMLNHPFLRAILILFVVWLAASQTGYATYISGNVLVRSTWADDDANFNPPGDGDSTGDLLIGIWNAKGGAEGPPFAVSNLLIGAAMPFASGVSYDFTLTDPVTGTLISDTYLVIAWVDANQNGAYDFGEPRNIPVSISVFNPSVGNTITVVDDSDEDSMPDWWEAHWFAEAVKPMEQQAFEDPDGDGLNEKFVVDSKSLRFISVEVFSRSGLKVYGFNGEGENLREWDGWDGHINNTSIKAAPGIYFYVIRAIGWDDVDYDGKEQKGFVYLYR